MRVERRPQHEVADLADRQHGVVSARQLRELGRSRSSIEREVVAGRLHQVHRGVYSVGHRLLTPHGRLLAAVLASGRPAILSHRSAAWLWDLLTTLPDPIHVTGPTGRHRHPSIRLHRARRLEDVDREVRDQIPVTAIPRTMLDLATVLPKAGLDRALERADRLALLDLVPILELLDRTRGHPGRRKLREALAMYRVPAFTRSELERQFLELISNEGLPRPAVNIFVAGHEVDMFWPAHQFVVELDGFEYHRTRAAFERDRMRQEDLKLAGIDSIRVTARRIRHEPATVVDRLRRLLDRQPRPDGNWTH